MINHCTPSDSFGNDTLIDCVQTEAKWKSGSQKVVMGCSDVSTHTVNQLGYAGNGRVDVHVHVLLMCGFV